MSDEPDEPRFTLLGRDPLAPPLIHEWVDQTRTMATRIEDPDERAVVLKQCRDAELIAWNMEEYQGRSDDDAT